MCRLTSRDPRISVGNARHHGFVNKQLDVRSEEVPAPSVVAAWFALDRLELEKVPLWAAYWLVDGFDGPALRELAGLSGTDPLAVRDLLPAALGEASAAFMTPAEFERGQRVQKSRYIGIAYVDVAQAWRDGRASERWVVDKVEEIASDCLFDEASLSPPLGQLAFLSDEWGAGWGRSEQELVEVVRSACRNQLRSTERR